MAHLLAISGSLREASSNWTLLRAGKLVAPPGTEIELYDGLARLPHFNPDDDFAPLRPAVADWRDRVTSADGLLISSPEYARGVPGSFKNALDWLVSDTRFFGKPVALWHAAPATRGAAVKAQLELILTTMSGRLVEAASVTVPLQGKDWTAETVAADDGMRAVLEAALRAFAGAIAAGAKAMEA